MERLVVREFFDICEIPNICGSIFNTENAVQI